MVVVVVGGDIAIIATSSRGPGETWRVYLYTTQQRLSSPYQTCTVIYQQTIVLFISLCHLQIQFIFIHLQSSTSFLFTEISIKTFVRNVSETINYLVDVRGAEVDRARAPAVAGKQSMNIDIYH